MVKKIYSILICTMFVNIATSKAQIKTIQVGKQVWMAENLNKDLQGSWYYNGNAEIGKKLGRLYTWEAAQKACPSGWHLPSDNEWDVLINALGGEEVAGKQLKVTGTSCFNAQLGGYADGHSFWFIDVYGGFWTSSSYDESHAWYRYFTKKDNSFTKTYFSKNYGFSVRCLRN